jgi:hypothetical protein
MVPDNCVLRALDAAVVHLDPLVLRELAAYTRTEWTPLSAAFADAMKQGSWTRHPSPEVGQNAT